MLIEGETYIFKYYKSAVFPDGEEYYLLESPYKSKHLLPKKTYQHYNFILNQEIKCIVDRINCSSRIFLEPEHPTFKLSGVYEMTYIRNDKLTTSKGLIKDTLILMDKNNIKYQCITNYISQELLFMQSIKFRLLRIKKGVFYIDII